MTQVPVDPGMLTFYKELLKHSPPESADWPLPQQRKAWDETCALFRAKRPPGVSVEDRVVNGVKVRIYRAQGPEPKPAVIYGHGGGWVLGSVETHDDMCAEMADGAGVTVVALDYRLAPEHPFPAQLEDSHAVYAWMRGQSSIDPSRILGAGDSAGGQMTAALALSLRDRGLPQLKAQVLIYPVLGADLDTASYRRNAEAPCLTRAEMRFYLDSFLGPPGSPAWSDPYAVPLLADVTGLPPAFITVAGHDPLYDDGVMFHDKLTIAGVPSKLRREPALAHSYMRARHVSAPAREGFAAIVTAVRDFAEA